MSTFRMPIPIMFVSDNPCLPGGLSRLGRDLATLTATLPEFRVGYLGRGVGQKRNLPFVLYDFPESGQWGENYIQAAWKDFAGKEAGIIMTLDDPSRRHWFANPIGLPEDLARFLGSGRNFKKWGHFPIDSTGPNGNTLSMAGIDCVARYDRVLATSQWGQNTLSAGGRHDADWLPHGIHTNIFHPKDKSWILPEWEDDKITVGCLMANQSRKDFPALFECFNVLKAEYGNAFRAWLHTDRLIGYWNVHALAMDYQVTDCLEVTMEDSDEVIALRYGKCHCTVLPTAGEGFGYPIAESLACGTACVTTNYAAGAELVHEDCRVEPVAMRVDTQHNVQRAVLSGYAFAVKVKAEIEAKMSDWDGRSEQLAATVEHLNWNKLKDLWIKWLKSGTGVVC